MKNILIIEDNDETRRYLELLIQGIDESVIVYVASTIPTAYQYTLEHFIDVFVVDIVLNPKKVGDISGLVFAKKVRKLKRYLFTPIIFITSLADPKMYAYSHLQSFQYIEKPFDKEKVIEVVTKALKYKTEREEDNHIFFRVDGILHSIEIEDILFVSNHNHKLEVHMKNDVIYVPYRTCKDLMKELSTDKFLQCSRSTIVNRDKIREVDMINGGISVFDSEIKLSLGTGFRTRFLKEMGLLDKKRLKKSPP